MIKNRYKHIVVFGYGDKETAEKLRAFYKKHTDKDVDFNAMRNPKSGFALLVFNIPLSKFEEINITTAVGTRQPVLKSSLRYKTSLTGMKSNICQIE